MTRLKIYAAVLLALGWFIGIPTLGQAGYLWDWLVWPYLLITLGAAIEAVVWIVRRA